MGPRRTMGMARGSSPPPTLLPFATARRRSGRWRSVPCGRAMTRRADHVGGRSCRRCGCAPQRRHAVRVDNDRADRNGTGDVGAPRPGEGAPPVLGESAPPLINDHKMPPFPPLARREASAPSPFQPLPEAGATQKRTLEAGGRSRLFGTAPGGT